MGSTDDLRKELDKLKADVARLRELGSEKMHAMRDSAEDEMQRRRHALRQGVNAGWERGRRAKADMEDEMSAHPYASFLAAVGVGFLLAKLLDIATKR
ncbi:MAG: hypothetical protein L0H73_17165 [Nitrococcus sp.]|nr:hypothetical protein [Nitrococcus sp.]